MVELYRRCCGTYGEEMPSLPGAVGKGVTLWRKLFSFSVLAVVIEQGELMNWRWPFQTDRSVSKDVGTKSLPTILDASVCQSVSACTEACLGMRHYTHTAVGFYLVVF